MGATFTVLYPTGDGLTFDHDYFKNTTVQMVMAGVAQFAEGAIASTGTSPWPRKEGTAPGFFAMLTVVMPTMDHLEGLLSHADAVISDVPSYYNGEVIMQIGETIE